MPTTGPTPHTPEELARAGADVFDRHVRPALRPDDDGKFVAIDVDTGDHEIDADDYAAVKRLRSRRPSAEIWLGRIGQPAAYRMSENEEIVITRHGKPAGVLVGFASQDDWFD